MKLYIETSEAGVYGLVDTFLKETIVLNTKTTYIQDPTAVFKGFTNNFSVDATANNVQLLDYFGYTDKFAPTNIKKRAKLYIGDDLFREGIVTLENSAFINEEPQLFELSFSDGKKNLTEILGEDTFADLVGSDIVWNSRTIQDGLQSLQTASDGTKWFVPFVSVDRIFSNSSSPTASQTDNIFFNGQKPITNENILLPNELRPAIFVEDILNKINSKYDINLSPNLYSNIASQLTGLAVMCVSANVAVKEVQTTVQRGAWDYDTYRGGFFGSILKPRFDPILKPNINGFEIQYLGQGTGINLIATFDMLILLAKANGQPANANFINYIEVWEIFPNGQKKRKLPYSVTNGSENRSAFLRISIGLNAFTPDGSSTPSVNIKPLIAVFVSAESAGDWTHTDYAFKWGQENWQKGVKFNIQPRSVSQTVSLFKSLPPMKLTDFVKSIYTMSAYKKFKEGVLNEFFYIKKFINGMSHQGVKTENDLTQFADLSKVTKKPNTAFDGYDLKHFTSDYQQNKAFAIANEMEWGQLKFPKNGKPKSEFKIETKFTAPVFNPVQTSASDTVLTFYPFGSEPKLNSAGTRFVYDPNVKEFPIFYYHGSSQISTPYSFLSSDQRRVVSINSYNKISHKSNRIYTGIDNYISSLFNIVTGDYIDQNTLYAQGYKRFIEGTLSGKNLIHTIDLQLPPTEMQQFDDAQEIIIKETKYDILESSIGLTDGKTKLILLNQ